jgi:hypothetical protein
VTPSSASTENSNFRAADDAEGITGLKIEMQLCSLLPLSRVIRQRGAGSNLIKPWGLRVKVTAPFTVESFSHRDNSCAECFSRSYCF